MLSEFDLIKHYFTRPERERASIPTRIALGIGDDCALLTPAPSPGMQMAISSDMLVEGRHFFAGADARMLGHKCLAVNLSDLAAVGAKPLAFTLALALPEAEPDWLAGFSEGLFALADAHQIELIGGDTTKGPLTICITIFGEVQTGHALLRAGAQVDDDIWISGTLGDARLALAGYRGELSLEPALQAIAAPRMHMPTPRVALGVALAEALADSLTDSLTDSLASSLADSLASSLADSPVEAKLAHAAIDISDGLVGDLGHILAASNVGASLNLDALPAGPALATQPQWLKRQYCAAGGDDYELCFTAAASSRNAIAALAARTGTPVTRVGRIERTPGLRLLDQAGQTLDLQLAGFDHFA